MTTREEAAAKALTAFWNNSDNWLNATEEAETTVVLTAADAHDAEHGIHRIDLGDEAVERAATAIRNDKFLPTWMPDAVLCYIARTVIDALKEQR